MDQLDERYMRRCFELARLGAGSVSPNPMVGAVLVHEGRVIGEGWHRRYGEAHAEVNAIDAVREADRALLPHSTLYCSLEPCFHHGKTPPCVDRVLREGVRRVVVACEDPNPYVAGQSFRKLAEAGVEVVRGVLEEEGNRLNRAFFTWIRERRPYVILKWAQTRDHYLGRPNERVAISGLAAQRLVHRWRSECDAILVGTATAVVDNPRLDTRHYFGASPLRMAFDRLGRIAPDHHLLDDSRATWIYGPARPGTWRHTEFFPAEGKIAIPNLLQQLVAANRAILLVEGGAGILNDWLAGGWWDELRVLENDRYLYGGLPAPPLPAEARLEEEFRVGRDSVRVFVKG
jgi:diaminohydroxyphosphoribosylaminopyrimidine deaminase/5-amino-6-(5-phosphoribosylamino)uracil reductase